MIEAPTRPPTIAEAVAFLLMPATKRYRRRCFAHWRERVGESFERAVRREFVAQWRKRRKKGEA